MRAAPADAPEVTRLRALRDTARARLDGAGNLPPPLTDEQRARVAALLDS